MKRSVTSIVSNKGAQPRGGFLPISEMEVWDISEDKNYAKKVEKLLENGNVPDSLMGQCFDYGIKLEYIDICDSLDYIKTIKVKTLRTFVNVRCGARMLGEEEKYQSLIESLCKEYSTPGEYYDRRKFIPIFAELARYEAIAHSGNVNIKPIIVNATENEAKALDYMLYNTAMFMGTQMVSIGYSPRFFGTGAKNVEVSACDMLFEENLIEFKYSKKEPTTKHTFQLILYYLMGLHERPKIFKEILQLGIINPRIGKYYFIEPEKLDKEMLKHIEIDIMGYKNSVVDKI